MWRILAGGLAVLLLIGAGVILGRSRAAFDNPLPAAPQRVAAAGGGDEAALPDTVPAASDRTREQKRFDRYDKDRDAKITRDEYFASRHKAFARLDANGDGMLSFDEWSVKAIAKFNGADKDKSGTLNAAEFATTAVVRKPRAAPKCACGAAPAVAASRESEEE